MLDPHSYEPLSTNSLEVEIPSTDYLCPEQHYHILNSLTLILSMMTIYMITGQFEALGFISTDGIDTTAKSQSSKTITAERESCVRSGSREHGWL